MNLLVFGLGRDSELWSEANREGTTVFLEDVPDWFRQVPNARSFLVNYSNLALPEIVQQAKWDVILVDGPMGFLPEHPGRGKSIEAAATLIASNGIVFIHDFDRPAERKYSNQYLGSPITELDRLGVFIASTKLREAP